MGFQPSRFFPAICVGLAFAITSIAPICAHAVVAPHLRELATAARVVVVGNVEGVTSYDQGRVAVARVKAEAVLKGTLVGEAAYVKVVERRDLPTPPIFRQGQNVVAFLKAAPRSSSLNAVLPQGRYYSLVDLEGARLVAESPESLAEIRRVVETIVDESRNPRTDVAQRAAGARDLTFELLSARHAALVEDGARSLTSVPNLAGSLTVREKDILQAALQREDLPLRVRIALVRNVGEAGLREAVAVLQTLRSPPELMEAAWQALGQLEASPSLETVESDLVAENPTIRAAAVRELLRQEGVAAISKVAPVALQDPEPDVRIAAVEALGALGKPEALPPLERVFAEQDGDERQAAARAILAIGGEPAKDALGRLTFSAPPEGQRYAFVCLMLTGAGRDDPLVKRIAETHPDDTIRKLATQGVDVHKH